RAPDTRFWRIPGRMSSSACRPALLVARYFRYSVGEFSAGWGALSVPGRSGPLSTAGSVPRWTGEVKAGSRAGVGDLTEKQAIAEDQHDQRQSGDHHRRVIRDRRSDREAA